MLKLGSYRLGQRHPPGVDPGVTAARDPHERARAGDTWWAVDEAGGRAFVKIGHPGEQGMAARRFAAERAFALRLQHPGLPRLLAHGTTGPSDHGVAPGLPWAAFEAIDGGDLSHHTQPHTRLPWRRVVDLVCRAADALHHAHRHGVLHRDLTPANLVWSPAQDRLVVIDFGIATDADTAQAADELEHTATGVLPGTLGYMAPEVLAGGRASVASDVFSLGVTLYELLAGRRPWVADSLGALFRLQAQADPPALAGLAADLPSGLAEQVHRCLSRDPAGRPPNAERLASALRAGSSAAPATRASG